MRVNLIITECHYKQIQTELFPEENRNEHFGFGLAGVNFYQDRCNLLLRKFISADQSCLATQTCASVKPKPDFVKYLWLLAKKSNSCFVDFHTHPFSSLNVRFSGIDDASEARSFPQVCNLLGPGPHVSVVLGKNSLDARWYNYKTKETEPVEQVKIISEKPITIIPTSSNLMAKNAKL